MCVCVIIVASYNIFISLTKLSDKTLFILFVIVCIYAYLPTTFYMHATCENSFPLSENKSKDIVHIFNFLAMS